MGSARGGLGLAHKPARTRRLRTRGLAIPCVGLSCLAPAALAGVSFSQQARFAGWPWPCRLAAAELSPAAARRPVVYLAAFPSSYVLSSLSPEGLFLLLPVGASPPAPRRNWPVAGILTAL